MHVAWLCGEITRHRHFLTTLTSELTPEYPEISSNALRSLNPSGFCFFRSDGSSTTVVFLL